MENENKIIHSYLSYKVGNETFATNVKNVKEILESDKITKVPHSPSYIMGIINLRGTVLPIVDARIKFGLPKKEGDQSSCVLVLNIELDNEEIILGALVDSVLEVFEIEDSQIIPPPTYGSKYKTEFIAGMFKIQEDFVMLMDMNKVFSPEEISIVQENSKEIESNHTS